MYILDICGQILDLDIGYIIYILYIYNFDNNVIHLIIIVIVILNDEILRTSRSFSGSASRLVASLGRDALNEEPASFSPVTVLI